MERYEELHGGAVFSDQILQHEKFDIPPEVLEQHKKITVPRQRLPEWAALDEIVPADALEREIEPVRDFPIKPAGTVDGLVAIDPVPWKDHRAADRVFIRDANIPHRLTVPLKVSPVFRNGARSANQLRKRNVALLRVLTRAR
jgi:hypothetical protein